MKSNSERKKLVLEPLIKIEYAVMMKVCLQAFTLHFVKYIIMLVLHFLVFDLNESDIFAWHFNINVFILLSECLVVYTLTVVDTHKFTLSRI